MTFAWARACGELRRYDAASVLRTLKTFKVHKSQLVVYSMLVSSPRANRLTPELKLFAREISREGNLPVRIRSRMIDCFQLDESSVPNLSKVQSYVNCFAKTRLKNNGNLDALADMIGSAVFTGKEMEIQAFTFGGNYDAEGRLVIGDGFDGDPFFAGVLTKNLLYRLDRPPATFVFYMDATFKLNQMGYPVFVCSISDKRRLFCLVAIFLISHRTAMQYYDALMSLNTVYERMTKKHLELKFVMGDADDAQCNAFKRVLRETSECVYLM
ncbi:hypothetical protein BBJ28_00000085 [Nothophytophthora sp. Chile5]|nr:hypothetical protein BBJ28_00000085 [Nothophytophthora sp. Chile5]